ncbi:MAG: BTAD domain-containing putative transcriptional regulator [Chloroflexales bacterium]
MPGLTISLLGTFHIRQDATAISDFYSNAVRALLAYLVVESDRPHERRLLADLFWPDEPAEKGLGHLRQALYRLDQSLAPAALPAALVISTRQTLRINPDLEIDLDAQRLIQLTAAARAHRHRRLTVCASCLESLGQAAEIYRGDFLAGFSASPPFDAWLLAWRERLRDQAVWALDALAAQQEQRGAWEAAGALLRRMIELEPWREEAHRRLMLALAHDGQRGAALAQYKRCRRILERDLDAPPAPGTVALAAWLRGNSQATWQAPPHAVPTVETPIIGRAVALTAIAAQLAAPEGRLLTLSGPAGSGKTRLAIAAATAERGAFADGVFFVSLELATDKGGLIEAIVETLSLPLVASSSDPLGALLAFLKAREVLLVLDNFEHLIEHAPLISRLLDAAPALRIIVTSRVPLHMIGEVTLRIRGLEAATAGGDRQPKSDPAVLLFLDAARQSTPDFAPDAVDLQTISAICLALTRLPLLIMLAAGLTAQMELAAILALVQGGFNGLETELRGLPERHRSSRSLFESIWKLLCAEQQRLLAECALFVGSFSSEAAVAVMTLGGSGDAAAIRLVDRSLESLVDHTLLQRPSPGRYALHPLMRQFAAERHALLPAAEQEAGRRRYRTHFLGIVAQHAANIVGPAGRATVELLRTKINDIHQAWRSASAADDLDLMDGAISGLLDLVRIGEVSAAQAFSFGDAIARLRGQGATDPGGDLRTRQILGRLLVAQAEMCDTWGDYGPLAVAAAEAVAIAAATGQPDLETAARLVSGKGLLRQGDAAAARGQMEQAYRLIRTCAARPQHRRLRSEIHYYLGLVAWTSGRFGRARAHYHAALRIAQSISYRYGEADAHNNLALVATTQGAYAAALGHAGAALDIYRAGGNRAGEGLGLISLGIGHMYCGEDTAALEAFAASERTHQLTGDQQNESFAALLYGVQMMHVGLYDQARAAFDRGIAISRRIAHSWAICMGLAFAGLLQHQVGDHAGAVACCREALEIAEQAGDMLISALALTHMGHALAALGQTYDAGAAYERALFIRRATGQMHLSPEPLAGLARLALDSGDLPTALAHSAAILDIYELTGLADVEEPARIILTCYRSLALAGDARAAPLINAVARQLRARAARLTSPSQQTAFCEAVAANRELLGLDKGTENREQGTEIPHPDAVQSPEL